MRKGIGGALPQPDSSPELTTVYEAPRMRSKVRCARSGPRFLGLKDRHPRRLLEAGRHSLLATQVLSRLPESSVRGFRSAALVRQLDGCRLAAVSGAERGAQVGSITPIPREGDIPLRSPSSGCWSSTSSSPAVPDTTPRSRCGSGRTRRDRPPQEPGRDRPAPRDAPDASGPRRAYLGSA